MEVSILGVGKMGGAIYNNLSVNAKYKLALIDPNIDKIYKSFGKSTNSNPPLVYKNLSRYIDDLSQKKTILVLAIKPKQLFPLYKEIMALKTLSLTNSIIVSIVAGISVSTLRTIFKTDNIVRAMPNTPATVGQGMTGLYFPKKISGKNKKEVLTLFNLLGRTLVVNSEKKLHSVTALSGSGPAYFFNFCEALLSTSKELGLSKKEAFILVEQTFIGACALFTESKIPVNILRKNVTSPGGTTETALNTLEKCNFSTGVFKAILNARDRSMEIGTELNSEIKQNTQK